MIIEVLRRAYSLQRKHCDAPVFNGPLDLVRDLASDIADLADLLGDPQLLRLAHTVGSAGSALKVALERSISERFVQALGEPQHSTEVNARALLGGLVTSEFMSLVTPSSGQVKLAEATKQFAEQLGNEASLIQLAVAIVANVATEVLAKYRDEVKAFLDGCLSALNGSDTSKIYAALEAKTYEVLTRWHATAQRREYAVQ